jgi:thiamine biosynthesis lipoprotein
MTALAETRQAQAPITSIRAEPDLIRTSFTAFATFGNLLVTRRSAVHCAREILAAELRAIDAACSRFRPDSELMLLNQAGGRRTPVSPLFAQAIAVALRAAAASDGDVDPTCGQSLVRLGYDRDFAELARQPDLSQIRADAVVRPMPAGGWQRVDLDESGLTVQLPAGVHLDLGATAKALAADRAASAIASATSAGVLVNLGGDIAVAGPPPATGWRVEIAREVDADDDGRPQRPVVIALWDGGLATSGTCSRTWRRGGQLLHHIVDPRTGLSAESCWATVSVAAATCVDANTASTAAIIRSAAAVDWLGTLGLPARLVGADGAVTTTGEWPDEL